MYSTTLSELLMWYFIPTGLGFWTLPHLYQEYITFVILNPTKCHIVWVFQVAKQINHKTLR